MNVKRDKLYNYLNYGKDTQHMSNDCTTKNKKRVSVSIKCNLFHSNINLKKNTFNYLLLSPIHESCDDFSNNLD